MFFFHREVRNGGGGRFIDSRAREWGGGGHPAARCQSSGIGTDAPRSEGGGFHPRGGISLPGTRSKERHGPPPPSPTTTTTTNSIFLGNHQTISESKSGVRGGGEGWEREREWGMGGDRCPRDGGGMGDATHVAGPSPPSPRGVMHRILHSSNGGHNVPKADAPAIRVAMRIVLMVERWFS